MEENGGFLRRFRGEILDRSGVRGVWGGGELKTKMNIILIFLKV
jgi:hypothetical protein